MRYYAVIPATLLAVAIAFAADPYIGFVYPAGGRQGTTARVVIGGQFIHGTTQVAFSGEGVSAHIVEYNKKLNPQIHRLLNEQRQELNYIAEDKRTDQQRLMLQRLNKVISDYTQQPACDSIANILVCDVTIAPHAAPGEREVRLVAGQGLTNPMPFFVGQLPEYTGEPLPTCPKPILGKEAQALRKRRAPSAPAASAQQGMQMMAAETMMDGMQMGESGALSDIDDPVVRVRQPCVVNGQIAPGSIDRYLVACRAGQELVIEVKARVLVPYLADAVPGWFQPVVKLCDSSGREIAYNDDYMFKPDPVLICKIPANGDYLLSIYDSIYRGREDFVYRLTIGSVPFITSRFPLGGAIGQPARVDIQGVNLTQNHLIPNTYADCPGLVNLVSIGNNKILSNVIPFALDDLPDAFESEPNNSTANALKLQLPIIINGCVDVPGDKDFYQFDGVKGEKIAAEVIARRLDSPLDSTLMILSPSGICVGYNDDCEDIGSGINTHHADSVLNITLPEDGTYTCILTDAQHRGGGAYAYRLRLSAPRPDFEIRLVPSHVEFSGKSASDTVEAHLIRRDGFVGAVKLALKEPPGFTLESKHFGPTQSVVKVTIRTSLDELPEPVALSIEGEAEINGKVVRRMASGAEDCMQAFFWRHLVPSAEMTAWVRKKWQGQQKNKKQRR